MELTTYDHPEELSVSAFMANLPELLGSAMLDNRRIIGIADFQDFRYVQFWAEEGKLIFEVISNLNIGDGPERALTPEQEAALETAGWSTPVPEDNPNWSVVIGDVREIRDLMAMVHEAVFTILGQGSTPELQIVQLRTFTNDGDENLPMMLARKLNRVYKNHEGYDTVQPTDLG